MTCCDIADTRELRHVLSAFVTGVAVVTTADANGGWHGLTVNSFASVSLSPPLVLWSQSLTAPSYPVFRACERFAVNILAESQAEISQRFAGGRPDKFDGIGLRLGLGGVPLLEACAAQLECAKFTAYAGGDHTVFLGRVERSWRSERAPLAFANGRYVKLASNPGSPAR